MTKRLFAAFTAIFTALAATACGPPSGPIDEIYCQQGERFLLVQVAINRFPPADAPDTASVVRQPVNVTVHAVSPTSNITQVRYEGLISVGISDVPTGPISQVTPYVAKVCWPADQAISLMVRAEYIAMQAGEELECTFEDGWKAVDWDVEDLVSYDHISVELNDLRRDSPPVVVQCVDYYVPAGYRGPALHLFPAVR